MDVDTEPQDEVFVKFTTKLTEYAIPDQKIAIPKKLRRLGLSQVVNHLLGRTDDPVPFDFLVGNKFLRTTLGKFITSNNISDEGVTIEYVLAMNAPESDEGFPSDDWFSAIDNNTPYTKTKMVITGSYDHVVRFWKIEKNKKSSKSDNSNSSSSNPSVDKNHVLELSGHDGPIKAVSSSNLVPYLPQDHIAVVSASQDQFLRLWHVSTKKNIEGKCAYTLVGHTGVVMDCSFQPTHGKFIASGGSDKNIKIWRAEVKDGQNDDGDDDEEQGDEKPSKRRRVNPDIRLRKSDHTLSGHASCVSSVRWISADEVVSGSWDHSIRFWDVNSAINTTTLHGNKTIQSLDYSQASQLVVTAHEDGAVRVWDRRAQTETSRSFTSHSGWVSSVSCHPSNPNIFVSGSYDNSIKVWDLRSDLPLHTITKHTDKVLCVGWYNDKTFLSGGADRQLRLHNLA